MSQIYSRIIVDMRVLKEAEFKRKWNNYQHILEDALVYKKQYQDLDL